MYSSVKKYERALYRCRQGNLRTVFLVSSSVVHFVFSPGPFSPAQTFSPPARPTPPHPPAQHRPNRPPNRSRDYYLAPPIPSPKTHTRFTKGTILDLSTRRIFQLYFSGFTLWQHIPSSFHELPSVPNTTMKNYSIPYSYSKLKLLKWQPKTFAFWCYSRVIHLFLILHLFNPKLWAFLSF